MLELKDNYKNIIDNSRLAFVKFGAPWCTTCKSVQPTLDKLEDKWRDRVDFYYIDLSNENSVEIANECSVKTLPTLVTFEQGVLMTKTGPKQFDELDLILKQLVDGYDELPF